MAPDSRLEPGDILFTRGESWISKLIRVGTRSWGEARTQVNHTGVIVEGGSIGRAVCVEALRTVKRHAIARRYGIGGNALGIFRPANLSPDQIDTVVEKAESYVGRKYGYGKIVAHTVDWILGGAFVFRRLARMEKYPICSYLVANSFSQAGYDFGVDPDSASPDDIWDFVQKNPEKYVVVRSLHPWPVRF